MNKHFKIISFFLCYSIIFCFLFLESSPFFKIHTGLDQNIYFNIAKGWLHGELPYKDTFDQKGILLYIIYVIAYMITSSSFFGLFVIEIFIFTFISYYSYKLSRLFLEKESSILIALLSPVMITLTALGGGTAEEFICFLQILFLYYFFKVQSKKSMIPFFFFIGGLSIAATFFIKFNLVIFFIPFLGTLSIYLYKNTPKTILRASLFFSLGLSTIIIPLAIYFITSQTLFYFFENYIIFNLRYSSENILPTWLLLDFFIEYIKLRWFIFPSIVLGICFFTFSKKIKYLRYNRYALAFSFCILYLMLFATFRPYYYLSIYILFPFGAISFFLLIDKYFDLKKYPYLTYFLILIIPIGIGLHINKNLFKEKRSSQEKLYLDLINCVTKDKGTDHNQILTLGLSTIIQTYSQANPSFKYFFYPNISYKSYPEIRDFQDSIILNKKTNYIITYTDSYYFRSYYRYFKPLYTNYDLISKGRDEVENRTYYLFKIRKE